MTVSRVLSTKMAVKMIVFWCSLILSVIGSNAGGEFIILHSPSSLRFSGSSQTPESLLKEVFSASLGLSVEVDSEWKGMSIIDPFNTPEAAVEVYIDGISSLDGGVDSKSQKFPLTVDEYEPDTYDALEHRIQQRFATGGNKLVSIRLSDNDELNGYSDVFCEIPAPKVKKMHLQHLKYSIEEDYQFLLELEALKSIIAKVNSGAVAADKIVDFYNFRFRTLHALSDFHGPNSLQTKEAKKLLVEALDELTGAFVKAYDGSVLVTAVATDVAHTRRTIRSPQGAPESSSSAPAAEKLMRNTSEYADDAYSADYAAVFNIILWFGVVFVFALVAIVYALMDMDPGRDSIIYRMTSTRMKKD